MMIITTRRWYVLAAIGTVIGMSLFAADAASGQVETGITEPLEYSQVAASEQGVISRFLVKEGDVVRAGDILAILDRDELEQARRVALLKASAYAEIEAARANLKLRKIQKDNMKALLDKGHANPYEVDQVDAQFDQAQAELRAAEETSEQNKAEVLRFEALLERRAVKSPIDGIVIELHKRAGEYVSANEPQVATVVRLDRLRVRFYLQLDRVETLQPQQQVTVLIGHNQKPVPATVDFISPVVDPETGLARVDILIDNVDAIYRSGIPCKWGN